MSPEPRLGAHAGDREHNAEHEAGIEIRWVNYLNNIVGQGHRAIKRLARPMLGFKGSVGNHRETGGASASRVFLLLFLDRGWSVNWILKLVALGDAGALLHGSGDEPTWS